MLIRPHIHRIGNILSGPVVTPLDKAIEPLHGFLLEPGYDMRVGIQGEGDTGMPQPLTDHLGINSGNEQYGGVGVSQIVKSDMG
ncbi:hypothetical protein ACFLWS_02210 [Chloroflexota bacterium]